MCLLEALIDISSEFGIKIAAAHYNHMLRSGAESDEEFVRNYCAERGIPFYSGSGDVFKAAKRSRRGVEETARDMRYSFLIKTAEEIGASRIATAHTMNDNAETLIMNLIRGAGLSGLSGIPPVRGNIIRPLLATSRAQIIEYLKKNHIPHIEDETNDDTKYTRNKIRHEVMPLLLKLNPQYLKNISDTLSLIRSDEEFLSGLAEAAVSSAVLEKGELRIKSSVISELPGPLSSRAVMTLSEKAGVPALNRTQIEDLLSLASGDNPSASVTLPGGFRASREYSDLIFGKAEEEEGLKPVLLNLAGKTNLNSGEVIECSIISEIGEVYNSLNTFCVKYDTICGKVTVRARKPGDRIRLINRSGGKTLKKLFIDEKVPKNKRQSVPVIADEKDVIAVSGFGINEKYRAEKGDRALIIKIMEEGRL